ncbi:hypothetical protein [Adhaeribacter soli]|uniref:Uncharacterized protein n=1 Tax=Adhaeribacter soli TaxID=2607655 RepID=A0A5N1ITP4_9BACT|nr:hypothetical protein [Adhaeribacter soli]KAA9333535.1 hypothetical protein F0P94_09755 [Adhaeribacter soli]
MIKAYKYFFYKIYKGSLGNGEESPIYAFSIAWGLLGMNLLSILFTLEWLFDYKLPVAGKPLQLLILGAFIYFNYCLLLKNGSNKKILEHYKLNPPIKEGTGTLLILGYIILSILFVIFIANLK